ncbi:hypothetical protein Bbelb_376750 [Branchiostoma belcheri]|nr:hypothetical protein Bbelb_376750 [Branchiostoma belcheri]
MASCSTEYVGSPPLVAKYVSIKVVQACGNVVVDWYALDVGQGELTFTQLYERLVAASEFRPHNFKQVLSRSATVQFFCNDEKVGRGIEVYSGLQVGQATKQFGCFIRMVIDKTAATTEGVPRPKTAFEVMMKASREQGQQEWMFPAYAGTGSTQQCSNNNTRGDIRLYNDIIDVLKGQGFRDLEMHAQELFKVATLPLLQQPKLKSVKDIVVEIGQGLSKYSEHLQASNQKVQEQRKQVFPTRSVDDGTSTELRVIEARVRSNKKLINRYTKLENHLASIAEYELCIVNDFAPSDRKQRYYYISELELPMSIELYTYKLGNNLGCLHFAWKVPSQEMRDLNNTRKMMHQAEKDMPTYHTREMRKQFRDRFSLVTNAKPVILKEMYQFLTNDDATEECISGKEIRQRLKIMLDAQDVDLIVDMRSRNEGRNEMYAEFWDEATKFIEEMQLATVDDRRHGQVCHMALALSVPDFINQVFKRLPEGAKVPSSTWVSLQFWPKNAFVDRAIRYTGRLGVKYMVQSRQLNHDHPDCHYAAAVFRYFREFAVMFRQSCSVVFLDDKHAIKVGEPGFPVAAVDRGKSVLVAKNTTFAVPDHDFTKLKLTPSVILVSDVPESADDSFYRGKVFIALKNATFQSSSPIRHQTELYDVLNQAGKLGLPILLQYSDGGPDHRVTYMSVQVSLICMFVILDLDMLVCARTAPQNSFRNPVERIMSIINLSLQAVGIMREKLPPEMEKLMEGVNSMKDARARALSQKYPAFKEAVVASTEKVRAMLNELFQRLCLKGEPFSTVDPATDDEVEEMWNLILLIDQTVTKEDTTKVKMQAKKNLAGFMQHCCISRHYFFSIKKCGNSACKYCKKPRLPPEMFSRLKNFPDPVIDASGEHFKQFHEVYGTDTSENHRPSLNASRTTGHGMPFNPSAEKTRGIVMCLDCRRPRTIHSLKALTTKQKTQLDGLKEESMYTCGVAWITETHPLHDICFGSDMHFTSSTVLLFSQNEVRGDEDDAAFGVLELRCARALG